MSKFTLVGQASDPATPAANNVVLFARTDGGFYVKDDAGNVNAIAGGTGGAAISISAEGFRVTVGGVSFSDFNGLNFGMAGSTITAKLPTVTFYENQGGNYANVNSAASNSGAANISFQRFSIPFHISATRLEYLGHLSVNGSTNYSSTMRVALYTMSGSTAGTVSTGSATVTANNAGYANESGTRWRSVPLGTWNMTPGEYGIAFMHSINGPAGTTGSVSIYGESNIPLLPNPGGAAVTDYFAEGIFNAASSAPQATVHLSDVNGSHVAAGAQPYFRLQGTF
jgi:hypothetical protein